jgi:hypothetical protein
MAGLLDRREWLTAPQRDAVATALGPSSGATGAVGAMASVLGVRASVATPVVVKGSCGA